MRRGGRGSAKPRWSRSVWLSRAYDLLSIPFLATFLLADRRIHPAHRLRRVRQVALVLRMWRNCGQVQTGTSFRAHVAMAAKILTIPPSTPGVLVEAGCWKGGTTANLSLIADLIGRELVVYDSFEGLPPPAAGDRWAPAMSEGAYRGELEEVRANVTRWGVIDRCEFRKGWFSDTLPEHEEPVVAAFVDVDHQASLHQCVLGLWPHLVDEGYLFLDEYTRLDYCAVFFSERFWRTYFDRPPPGLMGTGTGVGVGQYFVGPYRDAQHLDPSSVGWTRKDFYGEWDYWPDDVPEHPLPGGRGAARGPEGWTTTVLSVGEQQDRWKVRVASDPERLRQLNAHLDAVREARLADYLATTDEGRTKLSEALTSSAEAEAQLAAYLTSTDEGRRQLSEALAAAREAGEGLPGDPDLGAPDPDRGGDPIR